MKTNHLKFNKLLLISLALIFGGLFGSAVFAQVESLNTISPPLINLVPRGLGNDEIWYIGGTASVPEAEVIIYLQSASGELLSFKAVANEKGEWFYSHSGFLKEGYYKSWAQLKQGQQLSPPSPEVAFEILSTAFRFGNTRISYANFYLALVLILLAILAAVSAFVIYHFRHYYHKNGRLRKEMREAEEEVRKGFALLRQDIRAEIDFIGKLKKSRNLNRDERFYEEKLLKDLNLIENQIMKEIEDIEPIIS